MSSSTPTCASSGTAARFVRVARLARFAPCGARLAVAATAALLLGPPNLAVAQSAQSAQSAPATQATGTPGPTTPAAPPAPRAQPENPQAAVPPVLHRSALRSAPTAAPVPVGSWSDANRVVDEVGGWRSYLKEAHGMPTPPEKKK